MTEKARVVLKNRFGCILDERKLDETEHHSIRGAVIDWLEHEAVCLEPGDIIEIVAA